MLKLLKSGNLWVFLATSHPQIGRKLSSVYLIILPLLLGVFAVAPVKAQESDPDGPVKSRAHPDFDALGGRMGTFKVFPKVELKETYQTNVYATQTDAQSDLITVIVPTLDFKSDSSRHALNLNFNADVGIHTSNPSEDYQDYGTTADGFVDVTRNLKIDFRGSFDKGHEQRGAADEAGGKEPGRIGIGLGGGMGGGGACAGGICF